MFLYDRGKKKNYATDTLDGSLSESTYFQFLQSAVERQWKPRSGAPTSVAYR